MICASWTRIADWPRPARYVYFLISGLTFRRYRTWCAEGEPNPFVTAPNRHRQTSVQEIADIFAMTARDRAAFGRAQRGG